MKCPLCSGKMKEVVDKIQKDNISYKVFKCVLCGEELLNMKQLGKLASQYRELRKARESKFAKWGNSIAIRIPKEFIKELKIKSGRKALLKEEKGVIKIIPS